MNLVLLEFEVSEKKDKYFSKLMKVFFKQKMFSIYL